jgi:hypothetical protein
MINLFVNKCNVNSTGELLFFIACSYSSFSTSSTVSFSVDLRLPEDPFAPAKAPRVHTDDQEMEDPLLNSRGSDSEDTSSTSHSTWILAVVPLSIYLIVFLFTTPRIPSTIS